METFYEDMRLKEYIDTNSDIYFMFEHDGHLKMASTYVGDEKHGIAEEFNGGVLCKVYNYSRGKLHGLYETINTNGEWIGSHGCGGFTYLVVKDNSMVLTQDTYVNGRKHGNEITYRKDGTTKTN